MIDKEIKWNITLGETLEIDKEEFISIPIDPINFFDVFHNNTTTEAISRLLDSNSLYFNQKIHDNLSATNDFNYDFKISIYPNEDKTSYKIGYDIKQILKDLFKEFGIGLPVTFDNPIGLRDYAISAFGLKYFSFLSYNDYRLCSDPKVQDESQLIYNFKENIEKIINQMIKTNERFDFFIDKQVKEEKELKDNKKRLIPSSNTLVSPKNLLMYSAAKSLSIFRETGDIDYYKYSKDYYYKVSNNNYRPEWPVNMMVDGIIYNYDYTTYNRVFNYVRDTYFPKLYVDLGIEDKSSITIGETLTTSGRDDSKKRNKSSKEKKPLDYEKANQMLHRKIKYYKGLKNQGVINSVEKDLDYIGFVLDNNYVILDKFYDLNKDGTNRRPSINNAVYVVSLDVLIDCDFDKKKIRQYIEKNRDFKAFRLYHNGTDSYQKKINKVLDYKPVSTKSFKDYKVKHEEDN